MVGYREFEYKHQENIKPSVDEVKPLEVRETVEDHELKDIKNIRQPDITFIEQTKRITLLETVKENRGNNIEYRERILEFEKIKAEGITQEQRELIKEETGWSDKIVDYINNKWQYEILKGAGLIEVEINGRACLIKENIDLDYTDADGISNRDRIQRGLAPLDSKTGKPLELHHLGQKIDSPLVELTEEEHRTGEYKKGIKNQRINHETKSPTEVYVEGNNWIQERRAHWKARAEQLL